jgi:WD40 repeat protein
LDCFAYDESKIQVPAHSGQVAVSGHLVIVASNHHLKVFDLSVSDSPTWSLDTKSMHMKDSKITTMEFRPAGRAGDRGFFLWVGTKEGHLFEVDVRTGIVTGSKPAAHGHHISHIFRHGRSMITLDGAGKTLIFTPNGEEDVELANSQPRVFRIAEKQEFAKMIGGLLWTSTRAVMTGSGPTSKVPIIRVYDVFTPGSIGRSVQPIEHVGAVTSGSILSSQPQNVYLGHEGGFVSIWSIVTTDGIPQCIEVMKVSASDVLSLEGVGERLWAGGRMGTISAYDVVPRPWLVTNAWNAHPGLPVLRLATDPYSIEKLGRLCVVSVGRDEQVRLWDGLLGSDWIGGAIFPRIR